MNNITDTNINTTEEPSGKKVERPADKKFDYSDTFQLQLVAELMRNKAFAKSILPNIKPKYFIKDVMGDLVRVLQDYHANYGIVPPTADNFIDHAKGLAKKVRTFELSDTMKQMVTVLYMKDSNGNWAFDSNAEATIAMSNRFIQNAAMEKALETLVNDFYEGKEDYAQFVDVLGKALSAGVGGRSCSLVDHLAAKYECESQRDSELLGYRLSKFRTLSKNIDGIQPGLYLIGAETNVGKTAFLANLFLDILMTNPHVRCIYLSLDDNKNIIINRLVSITSRINLNQIQRKQGSEVAQGCLKNAYDTLTQLAVEGRLDILDISEVKTVSTVESLIRTNPEDLVVFIDGLFNLEVSQKSKGIREDNIERANKLKALVDIYNIPLFCSGELRKKPRSKEGESFAAPSIDDIMESGKYAYNANLVLMLSAENPAKYKLEDSPELVIEYAKNKLSHFRGSQKIVFHKAQSIMEEVYDIAAETLGKFERGKA